MYASAQVFCSAFYCRGNPVTWQILMYQFDSNIVEICGSETTISKEDLIVTSLILLGFSGSTEFMEMNLELTGVDS